MEKLENTYSKLETLNIELMLIEFGAFLFIFVSSEPV